MNGDRVENDEWGNDPSVRSLRRIFAAVEAGQKLLLKELQVAPFDRRLAQWRKMALHLFEQTWANSARCGVRLEEKDVPDLYLHCLARVMETRGVVVPGAALPVNDAVTGLLKEKK